MNDEHEEKGLEENQELNMGLDIPPPPEDKVDQEAKQFGHLTLEQWTEQGKDPSLWKSPEEFVQYGHQYKEFKQTSSELKKQNEELAKKMDILLEDRKRLARDAVKEAKAALELQMRNAKQMGDIDAVEQLTVQKYQLDQQAVIEQQSREKQERDQIDRVFLERNGHWFNDSRMEMKEKAIQVGQEILQYYPNLSYAEQARRIEQRMLFDHPELSVTASPSAPRVSASQSSVNKSSGGSTEDRLYGTLSPTERAEYEVMKSLLKTNKLPDYSIKDFIKDIRGNK